MRDRLSAKIPELFRTYDVFDKKGIDPKLYNITFNTAQGVPTKGGRRRDCGVWMRQHWLIVKE